MARRLDGAALLLCIPGMFRRRISGLDTALTPTLRLNSQTFLRVASGLTPNLSFSLLCSDLFVFVFIFIFIFIFSLLILLIVANLVSFSMGTVARQNWDSGLMLMLMYKPSDTRIDVNLDAHLSPIFVLYFTSIFPLS